MKVLLQEGTELSGLEKDLQIVLEKANFAGYALMGFSLREVSSPRLHAIDALLIIEPGVFVCLEAKGYKGKWTGSVNEKWFCDQREINSVGINPYKQVERYSLVVKNKLTHQLFENLFIWVNNFVIAPDETDLEIRGAIINQFKIGKVVSVCHLSKIEQVLNSIGVRKEIVLKVRELGLEKIISELLDIPQEKLEALIVKTIPEIKTVPPAENLLKPVTTVSHSKTDTKLPDSLFQSNLSKQPKTNTSRSQPTISQKQNISQSNISKKANTNHSIHQSNISKQQNFKRQNINPDKNQPKSKKTSLFKVALLIFGFIAFSGFSAFGYYLWNNRSCEHYAEVRIQGVCYKNFAKTPLVIGILTQPHRYNQLKDYLKQKLGSQAIDVVIEGDSQITYQEAQNHIAKKDWDIVFALSPMNGMRAKDNGYKWVGRMFPEFPETYQSALFVRRDNPIQSISDIKSSTIIALGDENSASSFYIPAYDLYGKSMTVKLKNESHEIINLVANGQVDVGAVVYSRINNNPLFRVIHLSREIPATGVYLSDKIHPKLQREIEQILINAPEEIQQEANYGKGVEPNYEYLRGISFRADEVLSCADFSKNPVQFFCKQTPQGIQGKISGFTTQNNGIVSFHLEREAQKSCDILISLQTLRSIPGGTSPEILNQKFVNIVGVEPKQLENGKCELTINQPNQLIVLN